MSDKNTLPAVVKEDQPKSVILETPLDRKGLTLKEKVKKVYNQVIWLKNRITLIEADPAQGDGESYEEMIRNNSFDDKFCYGISQEARGFHLLNPFEKPGALYVGAMGSGKSQGMRFTILTHMLTNSEKTVYLLYDQVKDMGDYKIMFPLRSNVAKALGDGTKIIPIIEMLYSEILARQVEFRKYTAADLRDYEKIMKKNNPNFEGLARIVFAAEEFHAITSNPTLNFQYKNDVEGTAAWKLRQIMRIGRSYGVFLLAATQRFTSDDFPTALKPAIAMQMCFRAATVADVSFMGLSQAVDIQIPGRCAYVGGSYIQYPWMPDSSAQNLLNKYFKPLKAKLLKYQMDDYHTAFESEGNEGLVDVLSFENVTKNYQQYSFPKICSKFLNAFDFTVEKQQKPALIANFIATRNSEKYAVVCFADQRDVNPDKQIAGLKNVLNLLNVDKILVFFAEQQPPSIKGNLPSGSLVIDKHDLLSMAKTLDSKDSLLESEFSFLYESLPLTEKKKLMSPESKNYDPMDDLDDMDDEEMNDKIQEVKKLAESVILSKNPPVIEEKKSPSKVENQVPNPETDKKEKKD